MTKINSISVSGRITLNMHSLNNEGNEGNQVLTRQVTIIDKDKKSKTVTAVSGDISKHFFTEHLYDVAKEMNLNLCEGCKVFNANRISIDNSFLSYLRGIDPEEFTDENKEKFITLKTEYEKEEDKTKQTKFRKEMRKIEEEYLMSLFSDEDKTYYEESKKKLTLLNKEKRNEKDKTKKANIESEIKDLKKQIEDLNKKYQITPPNDADKLDEIIKRCVIDEISGILVTAEKNNLPRKSVAEFGWMVALPDSNETDNYFHAKFVPNASSTVKSDSNEGQNIFHRPANSGIYAYVANLEVGRLGYNDISKKYSIKSDERKKRYKALLKAFLYSFIKPGGAMRNTQNPHIVDFEGVVSYSTSSCPAPTVSGLKDDYCTEIVKTAKVLNEFTDNSITTKEFKTISEFTEIVKNLIQNTEPKEI